MLCFCGTLHQPSPINPSNEMDHIQTLLQNPFGLQEFRPGQEDVITRLLQGHSCLAVFPTGGGKSLCYQLPALALEGLTIVVSPLIALMKDQVDRLQASGIAAARLDSTLDAAQTQNVYRQLERGDIKLLYIAPERVANERFFARLQKLNISLLAIDEAHCVSEWGHNFRPDYLKLAAAAQQLRVPRVLALTATATPDVAAQICASFAIEPANHVQTGFYRANLSLNVTGCTAKQRNSQLLQGLQQRPSQATIVYVTLQKTAASVAALINAQGLVAMAYHAGLKDDERSRIQDLFMSGEVKIIVATIAFGMGIDKADIRAIYHYNLPKSLENYMQEIGRAGRDGLPAHCEVLACPDDLTVLENFTFGDTPDSTALAELIRWLLAQEDEFNISVHDLSQQWDIRPLVVTTLLTYLELEGILQATTPFYSQYRIAPQQPLDDITSQFDSQRADFLRRVFNSAKAGRVWLTLELTDAAAALGEDPQRIRTALEYLKDKNLVDLQVAGVRQGYRKIRSPTDSTALIANIEHRFAVREQRDIERMAQMCQWLQSATCLQQAALHYFGEAMAEPCGRCSVCRGGAANLPPRERAEVNHQILEKAVSEQHPALKEPRQLARFLCGLTSPKTSRARLGKHPMFGSQASAPFMDVLAAAEARRNKG